MALPPRRLVVKFGGSVLTGGAEVAEAARLIAESPAEEKLVVVSAPLGMTDRLLSLVDGVPDPVGPADRARLMAYGERISARLLVTVLRARGLRARVLEPEDPEWPILTAGGSIDATIRPEASRRKARRRVAPLLRRSVVVVLGFLGWDGARVTTLPRGGSDTTACALARFLDATDLVLVKDVPGVLTANPKLVDGARPIGAIGSDDLAELVGAGARVVAPEAVEFLPAHARIRIIPFGAPLVDGNGTTVHPISPRPSDAGPTAPRAERRRTGSVTLLLRRPGDGLATLAQAMEGRPWLGLSATPTSLTVYTEEAEVVPLLRALHATGAFKAVASHTGLALSGTGPPPPGRARARGSGSVVGAFGTAGGLRYVVRPGGPPPATPKAVRRRR
jgi:hypothetical protein